MKFRNVVGNRKVHTPSLGVGLTLTQQNSGEIDSEVRKRKKNQEDTPPSVSVGSGSKESVGEGLMLTQRKSGERDSEYKKKQQDTPPSDIRESSSDESVGEGLEKETVRFANARRTRKTPPQSCVPSFGAWPEPTSVLEYIGIYL